jgi:hypothetical protein
MAWPNNDGFCDRTQKENGATVTVNDNPNAVWVASIDNHTWHCRVEHAEADHRGVLIVSKVDDNDTTEILREEVGLAFDAIFGPDQEDVLLWVTMAIDAVDHYNAQQEAGQKEDRSNL